MIRHILVHRGARGLKVGRAVKCLQIDYCRRLMSQLFNGLEVISGFIPQEKFICLQRCNNIEYLQVLQLL